MSETDWRARRRRREIAYFCVAFLALVAVGLVHTYGFALDSAGEGDILIAVAIGAACLAASAYWRRAWHAFANTYFLYAPIPVRDPVVLDGDTIDDRGCGVRYRLANIDAPEMNARCGRERGRAELASVTLKRLVSAARCVEVRRAFRTDMYGRRVAFLLLDGADAGAMLIARGLAVPWKGARRKWCGPKGGLAKIAKTGALSHSCRSCGA
ncbi:MAG TPA: thermonuclease family protein [Terricaulis sp.]|nr:thermonuclease family protein [Terricaulis sp.]